MNTLPDVIELEITEETYQNSMGQLCEPEGELYYCNNCLVGQAIWDSLLGEKLDHVEVGLMPHLTGKSKMGAYLSLHLNEKAYYEIDRVGSDAISGYDTLTDSGGMFNDDRRVDGEIIVPPSVQAEACIGHRFPFKVTMTKVKS